MSTIMPQDLEKMSMMSAGAPSPTVASDQSHESFGASRPSIVTAWLFPAKPAANCFANLWAKASPAAAVIGILACGGVAASARRGPRGEGKGSLHGISGPTGPAPGCRTTGIL